jgi:hypothetical protein
MADKEGAGAQAIQSWPKDKVTAMLFVKPNFGVFVPFQGNTIGVTWTKDEVVPICLVKPSIGGFEPIDGSAIGNTWPKSETKPVVLVEPYLGMFVVSGSTTDAPQTFAPAPANPAASRPIRSAPCSPAVETRIDGEFTGWNGETLYKMDDGTIWQHSNYHYHYHYSFHPSVVIYAGRAGACHIKVTDDDDDGVDVVRIK